MNKIKNDTMKLIKYIFAILFITTVAACSELEKEKALESPVAPTLASHGAIIINGDNLSEMTTFKWQPADFGYIAAIQYSLSAKIGNGTPVLVGSAYSDSIAMKLGDLNGTVIGAGAEAGIENTVTFTVSATISEAYQKMISAPLTVKVTPYEPQPSFIYVIGQFQGWNTDTPVALTSLLDNKIYAGYVKFEPGNDQGWLLVPDKPVSWQNKWGSDDGVNLIVDNGKNMAEPGAGWYRIDVNLNSLIYSTLPFGNLGIVGTINAWGPPDGTSDIPMIYNDMGHRWEATITCAGNDEIKFRLNESWGTNWGGKDGVAIAGGDNIKIADAGTYLVTLDFTDLNSISYTITKQ
jgi:hypothetical protein